MRNTGNMKTSIKSITIIVWMLLFQTTALFQFSLTAQEGFNVNLLGKWGYGPCYGVDVKDQTAYYGSGSILVISDLSDPHNYMPVGELTLPGIIHSVIVQDDFLFVNDREEGIFMYDITDPQIPVFVGQYAIRDVNEVVKSDTLLFIASSREFTILNVRDPSDPIEIYSDDSRVSQIELSGPVAFLAITNGGLKRIDISDPASPAEIDTYVDTTGGLRALDILNDTLYIANSHGQFVALEILDSGYEELCRYSHGSVGSDVVVRYPYAYFGASSNGLRIMDISDIRNPVRLSTTFFNGNVAKLKLWNQYIFSTFHNGALYLLDISNPNEQVMVSKWPTGGYSGDHAISNETMFLTQGSQGLHIFDISDPGNLIERSVIEPENNYGDVFLVDNLAYIAGGTEDLIVYDVSDPDTPVLAAKFEAEGYARYVILNGQYAYLSSSSGGLRILDVSNLDGITESGFYSPGDDMRRFVLHNDFIYMLDRTNSLHVIDVSDKTSPSGFVIELEGRTTGIALSNHMLYISRATHIDMFDITDPGNPVVFGTYDIPYSLTDIAIEGDYAYTLYPSGVRILDISDLATINEVAWYRGLFGANSIIVSNGILVVGEQESGFTVLEHMLSTRAGILVPEPFMDVNVRPLPFTDVCQIEYRLDNHRHLTMQVYDRTGKLVNTLWDNYQDRGTYQIEWNPKETRFVAPGTYFLVVRSGVHLLTKKLVYMPLK
jgi:hypothetical protein